MTLVPSLPFVLRWLRKNARKRGPIGLADFVISFLSDYLFDFHYGTSTREWVPLDKIKYSGRNYLHAVGYQPTRRRPFRNLMKQLRIPKENVFIDVGCGKGKVLLMASRYGFKKLRGIEFDGDMCKIARENIAIFCQKTRVCIDIEVIESDALEYEMTGEENVFFLYNPFDSLVLNGFLENIKISLLTKPRKIWMIYHTPIHANIVSNHDIFRRSRKYSVGGNEFMVYVNE